VSEDFSIWVVGLRRFVTLCKTAPYSNSLTYLLSIEWGQISDYCEFVFYVGCVAARSSKSCMRGCLCAFCLQKKSKYSIRRYTYMRRQI